MRRSEQMHALALLHQRVRERGTALPLTTSHLAAVARGGRAADPTLDFLQEAVAEVPGLLEPPAQTGLLIDRCRIVSCRGAGCDEAAVCSLDLLVCLGLDWHNMLHTHEHSMAAL